MRRAIAVVAVLVGTLVVTAPAEAATTSEKEGRKFSRKLMKKESGRFGFGPDWVQRDCYRIGREESAPKASLRAGSSACSTTSKKVESAVISAPLR